MTLKLAYKLFYGWSSHQTTVGNANVKYAFTSHMNISKNIYWSCRERHEFMIDHRSYTHLVGSSWEIKA